MRTPLRRGFSLPPARRRRRSRPLAISEKTGRRVALRGSSARAVRRSFPRRSAFPSRRCSLDYVVFATIIGKIPSYTLLNKRGARMDAVSWSVAAPAIGSAFLASLVEVVEAFTIVLAVGTLRGWRPAALARWGAWRSRRDDCCTRPASRPHPASPTSVGDRRALAAVRHGMAAQGHLALRRASSHSTTKRRFSPDETAELTRAGNRGG